MTIESTERLTNSNNSADLQTTVTHLTTVVESLTNQLAQTKERVTTLQQQLETVTQSLQELQVSHQAEAGDDRENELASATTLNTFDQELTVRVSTRVAGNRYRRYKALIG